MKKLTILIVLGLLCFFSKVDAQLIYNSNPLTVGDTIPDIVLNNVVNFKTASIRLSEFKNQLVILDFWATSCIPCVRHLPAIYDLQKKFTDKVFFLLVDGASKYDSPAKVRTFFNNRKKLFNLPSVVLDSVLWKLIQPQSLGVYVWIKNGVVMNVTEEQEVTADNIEKALSNKNLVLQQAIRTEGNYQKPFFDSQNVSNLPSKYFMRSMLFPYNSSMSAAGWQTDSTGKVIRISFNNATVLDLLMYANPGYNHFNERVKKVTVHRELLQEDFETDSARRKNMYSYEAIFAPVSRKKAAEYIKQDISRYFPFTVDTISVTDTCWILQLSKTHKLKKGDPGKFGTTNIEEGLGLPIYIYNRPLSDLRRELEHRLKIPVLDDTGFKGNLWLDLPPNILNMKLLCESLANQGIILFKEVRPVEFLVIKDRIDIN